MTKKPPLGTDLNPLGFTYLSSPAQDWLGEDAESLVTPPRDRKRSGANAVDFLIFKRQIAKRIIREMENRETDALRLYHAMPEQARFHESNCKMRLLRGGNRSGKAVQITEPVWTPDGWRPIGELKVGDAVFGGDGKPCKVTAVHPQGVIHTSRITFNDGTSAVCCKEHLWRVWSSGEWRVRNTRWIRRVLSHAWLDPSPVYIPKFGGGEPERYVVAYKYEGEAECVCIEVDSPDHTYVIHDFIVTHNTTSGAVEVARAATGRDPHNKYQTTGLRIMLVGRDADHSRTFYRKLFSPGVFKTLTDESGKPYVVSESNPVHLALKHRWRPSEPLIPSRYVVEIAWEKRNREMPKMIRLINDIELHFASGQGKPKRGVDLDLVWFDEEIEDPEWYPEALTRLIDRNGKFIWTATPQSSTVEMYELYLSAIEGDPSAADFCIKTTDNYHLSAEGVAETVRGIKDSEERKVRIDGDFRLEGVIVYSSFNKRLHTVSENEAMPNGCIPEDWCIYVAIDPGVNPMAVLFVGVPPRQDRYYVFDELYIRKASAETFGEQLELKLATMQEPEIFIIDIHGSKLTDLGSGQSPLALYRQELKKRNLRSRLTGENFHPGVDNEQTRISRCKAWLPIDEAFKVPKLALVAERCPNFLTEIGKYAHMRDGRSGGILDKTVRGFDHLMDCWGMIAAFGPKWNPSRVSKGGGSSIWKKFQEKRRKESSGKGAVRLGPQGQW